MELVSSQPSQPAKPVRRSRRKPKFVHSDAHEITGSQELQCSSTAFHDAVSGSEGWKCFIETDHVFLRF